MIRLMFDNIQIAHEEVSNGKHELVLEKGIESTDPYIIPKELFPKGVKRIPLGDILGFIEWRVFPKEREDCDKLLKELGLEEYDPLEIAKKTKASLIEDGWWIAFNDTDTYQKDTLRGKLGYTGWR
ncbi:hypothetical protein P9X10_03050 [Bacillus cereus]|nr:hypothetical protein [Bacillus cereus]